MSDVRSDPFLRAARFVGDFSNPFYAEERQRDVWNEASAFGFQLLLSCTLLAATVAIWVVGAPAEPYVLTAVGLTGVVSLLTLTYARRLGVDVASGQRLNRARMVPFGLLAVAFAIGLLRASDSDVDAATAAGMVTGASVALGALALVVRRARTRPDEE